VSYALAFNSNHRKTSVMVVEKCPVIPVAVVQCTFTHKQYTEQHNETKYTERNIHNNKKEHTYGSAVCTNIVHSSTLLLLHLAVQNSSHNIQTRFFRTFFFSSPSLFPSSYIFGLNPFLYSLADKFSLNLTYC
jgi:hypothetical protein